MTRLRCEYVFKKLTKKIEREIFAVLSRYVFDAATQNCRGHWVNESTAASKLQLVKQHATSMIRWHGLCILVHSSVTETQNVKLENCTRREFLREILYKLIAIIAIQHSNVYFVDTSGDFSHTVGWNSLKSVWKISLYILAQTPHVKGSNYHTVW